MAGRLHGKTTLLTGAGSIGPGWGNGNATAVECDREGAKVVCVDRNETAARRIADIMRSEGGTFETFAADVSMSADVRVAVNFAIARFGRTC